MDKAEMCKLIAARSQKLRSLREQAANGNNEKRKLFMGAIMHLLQDQNTQQSAYQQITQLAITANPEIAKILAQQLLIHIPEYHSQNGLIEHVILWGRMFDGSLQRKQYPNVLKIFQNMKIKQNDRELSPKYKNYFLEFQQNFNQRNDDRVQFFQDFDDSAMSDSIDNDSQFGDIFYLNTMELKVIRQKLQHETLTEQALNQQVNKIKYILNIKEPKYLSSMDKTQYQSLKKWAIDFLSNQEEFMRKNHSLTINQTFNISGEEEHIQIVDKDKFAQRRTLKEAALNNHKYQFQQENQVNQEGKSYQQGQKRKQLKIQDMISPVKRLTDPKYVHEINSSKNSQIQAYQGSQSKDMRQQFNRKQQSANSQVDQQNIVVHRYSNKNENKDYSSTDMFRRAPKTNKQEEVTQLSKEEAFKSRTLNQFRRSQYLSPMKPSRCKLSDFTSQKKQRRQLAPREQLSFPEEYFIRPYLSHFASAADFCNFRRNCFQTNFTVYVSDQLTVTCSIQKEANSQIKVQFIYLNQLNLPIQIDSVYKIPKCFKIYKKQKISKHFTLHNTIKHVFGLSVEQFPLEPCLLNLTYRLIDNISTTISHSLPLALTILNFIDYLIFSKQQWVREWENLNEMNNKNVAWLSRHIEVDKNVVGDELQWILREIFMKVGFVEGYSIQDYGCWCFQPTMNNLNFLVRISLRVDSIVSIQLVSNRQVDQNQLQFMKYCLNIWMMLLTKLYL